MQIAPDAHVTLRYAVALESEGKPDCEANGQVTEFICGRGQILAGLEAKLSGHAAGERFDLLLQPAEAFGEVDPELEMRVPFSEFPDDAREHLKPGVRFRGPHPTVEGREVAYVVREVSDEGVLASGNHPLAGKTLQVACEVLTVREATEEELSGGGCCSGGGCGSGECGGGGCGSHEGHDHDHEHAEGGCGSGGCGHHH